MDNEDIKILEEMRDNIYGAMQFEDDYQVSELEEKQFNALNLAIKSIARYKELEEENKEIKEKIKGLECEIEIKKYCKVDEVINDLTYYKNLAKEYQGNCIPKSKVKGILNKLSNHNYKCNFDDVDFLQNIIIEIHHLLED